MVLHTQGTSERQTPPKLLSCFVGLEGHYGLQPCKCQDARCSFPHLSVSMSWVIANNSFTTGQIIFIVKAKRKKSNK